MPVRQRVEEPVKVASARLSMKSPRVTEVEWSRQWLAPSYNRGDTTEAYPLQVLAGARREFDAAIGVPPTHSDGRIPPIRQTRSPAVVPHRA